MQTYQPEILNRKEQHIKDVYAHYGLTSYVAQCFEQELVLFLSFVEIFEIKKTPPEKRDLIFEKYLSMTCGRLIREVKDLIELEKKQNQIVTTALEKRNYLTHHFFYEKSLHFLTEKGRQKMITELEKLHRLFGDAEALIKSISSPYQIKYGLTPELLENHKKEFIKNL